MSTSIAPGIKQIVGVWPLILFLIASAGIVGEARYRLAALEDRVARNEAQNAQRMTETSASLRRMNDELRTGLGKVQLGMARICIKLNVECD